MSWLIVKWCQGSFLEWDAAPCRYQWVFPFSWDDDLQSLVGLLARPESGLISLVDLRDRDLELACQCFGERDFHDPLEMSHAVQVVCELVVFHESPVLRLELCDDTVGCLVDAFGAMDWFPVSHVGLAFLAKHVQRHF